MEESYKYERAGEPYKYLQNIFRTQENISS